MTEPLLVIHGVANHEPERFRATVDRLQQAVGDRYRLVDVFWGDLGGTETGLRDTLPTLFPQLDLTRGEPADSWLEQLGELRQQLMGDQLTRSGDAVVELICTAALAPEPGAQLLTRSADTELREALRDAVAQAPHLRRLQTPEAANAAADLLRALLASAKADTPGAGFATRGLLSDAKAAVAELVAKVDALVGAVISEIGGGINQWLRGALARPIALSLGDIVAYHQRRREIHTRLFVVLDQEAPGYGTAERPINVLAHSLGGLVSFDAALGADLDLPAGQPPRRLCIKHWITCGSQPAFFHVLAPRNDIAAYASGQPVTLPESIGRWTNLWHPLDLLAFAARPVFRLSGGGDPTDLCVDAPASALVEKGFWTHSIYWESGQLLAALNG